MLRLHFGVVGHSVGGLVRIGELRSMIFPLVISQLASLMCPLSLTPGFSQVITAQQKWKTV